MAVTINSNTFDELYLTEQPYGYDETDVTRGRTASKWVIAGLMSPADWLDLLNIYNGWRNTRITDSDPATSAIVGATVTLSCKGPGGVEFNNIDCWFNSTPSSAQSGKYVNVSFELINANQALEVILAEASDAAAEEEELQPDLGTITIGSATLTLRKPIDAYGDGPSLELTPTGVHYITGPLVVYKIKDIEGETDAAGFAAVRTWYESQIIASPISGSDFPITPPSATVERKIIYGVTTDVYTVTMQLAVVL